MGLSALCFRFKSRLFHVQSICGSVMQRSPLFGRVSRFPNFLGVAPALFEIFCFYGVTLPISTKSIQLQYASPLQNSCPAHISLQLWRKAPIRLQIYYTIFLFLIYRFGTIVFTVSRVNVSREFKNTPEKNFPIWGRVYEPEIIACVHHICILLHHSLQFIGEKSYPSPAVVWLLTTLPNRRSMEPTYQRCIWEQTCVQTRGQRTLYLVRRCRVWTWGRNSILWSPRHWRRPTAPACRSWSHQSTKGIADVHVYIIMPSAIISTKKVSCTRWSIGCPQVDWSW